MIDNMAATVVCIVRHMSYLTGIKLTEIMFLKVLFSAAV